MESQITKNIQEAGQILLPNELLLNKSPLSKKKSYRYHKKVCKKRKSYKKIMKQPSSDHKAQEKQQIRKAIQNLQQCQILNNFLQNNVDWGQSDFLKETAINFNEQIFSKQKINNHLLKQTKKKSNQIHQNMNKPIQIIQDVRNIKGIFNQSIKINENQTLQKSELNKSLQSKNFQVGIICNKIILKQPKKFCKNQKQIQNRVLKCKQVTICDLTQGKQTQRKNNYNCNVFQLSKRRQIQNKRKKNQDSSLKSLTAVKIKQLNNNKIQRQSLPKQKEQHRTLRKNKTQCLSKDQLFKEESQIQQNLNMYKDSIKLKKQQSEGFQNKLQYSSYSVDKRYMYKMRQFSIVQSRSSIFEKASNKTIIKSLPRQNIKKSTKKQLRPSLNKQKQKIQKSFSYSSNDFFVQNPQYLKKSIGINYKNYYDSPLRNYLKFNTTAYKK